MGLRSAALPVAFISSTAIVAAPHAAAAWGDVVTYEVDSNGSLSGVSYSDAMNDVQQITDVNAPWTITFTSRATVPEYGVSAETNGSSVSCRITVNGHVHDQKSATGRYAVVSCSA